MLHFQDDDEAEMPMDRHISKTQQAISRFHSPCAPVVCTEEALDSLKKVNHGSQERCLESRQAPNSEIQHFMRVIYTI